MLSPEELIGQKVWLSVERDPDYPDLDPYQVKAEITQPTSPPWFFARYLNPPPAVRAAGQWLTLREAEEAMLYRPVLDEFDYDWEEEDLDDPFYEDELGRF